MISFSKFKALVAKAFAYTSAIFAESSASKLNAFIVAATLLAVSPKSDLKAIDRADYFFNDLDEVIQIIHQLFSHPV